MKQQQIINAGLGGLEQRYLGSQPALVKLALKSSVAIGAERVPTRETVTSQPFTHGDSRFRILLNQNLTWVA